MITGIIACACLMACCCFMSVVEDGDEGYEPPFEDDDQ